MQEQDNRIQTIQYENVTLKTQRDVYQIQLQRCQDQIHDIITNRHAPPANHPRKDRIVMIIEKNTISAGDEFYEYTYYITRIQRRFIATKGLSFRAQYLYHRFIVEEQDNANSIHAYYLFEEEDHVELFQCHFKLADLAPDAFHVLGIPAIQE